MNDQFNKASLDDEISLKDIILKFRVIIQYLRTRWMIIMIVSITGGLIGLTYAFLKPHEYTSRISFVLEESKGSGGGLASLAGQFGFDLGAIGGAGGGVFSGENILLFFQSESLIRETLFTPYGNDNTMNLADSYAESMEMKKNWQNNEDIGQFQFSKYNWRQLPRIQDSLLQLITKQIIKKNLQVEKPDKKASFIDVKFSSRDELLSQYFVRQIVKIATQHYVDSKTNLKAQNVAMLQRKADSLEAILNSRTYSSAASQQILVDANPGLKISAVPAEITTRDKTVAATLYAEVVKNLEISKTLLSQVTPSIQIVDESSLPLEINKVSKKIASILGIIIAGIIAIIYLLIMRYFHREK
jgi:hypothetical protein